MPDAWRCMRATPDAGNAHPIATEFSESAPYDKRGREGARGSCRPAEMASGASHARGRILREFPDGASVFGELLVHGGPSGDGYCK